MAKLRSSRLGGEAMRIEISNLSEGIHEYALTAAASEVGLGEQFLQTVHAAVTLNKNNRQLYLRAQVKTVGTFRCDRCIDEFDRLVKSEFQMVYTTEEADRSLYDPDEVQVVPPELHEIEIGEEVRQYLLLAIPQKLLCKESCAGLCPRCGRNLNRERCTCNVEEIDPRWEKLRGLMDFQ
jgi:uncharacterized protein